MMFWKTKSFSTALIDITADTISVGFMHERSGELPQVVYGMSVPLSPREHETPTQTAIRVIPEALETLRAQGIPVLARIAQHARLSAAVVAIGTPWQETHIRRARIEEKTPFTFTRELMQKALSATQGGSDKKLSTSETVIATLVNGYETQNPFGMRASAVDIISASSSFDTALVEALKTKLFETFHLSALSITAAPPLWFSVLRDAFPHEHDFLGVAVSTQSTDIFFVRENKLTLCATLSVGFLPSSKKGVSIAGNENAWQQEFATTMHTLMESLQLPRTVFVFATDAIRDAAHECITTTLHTVVGQSTSATTILPMEATHFATLAKTVPGITPQVSLSILARYASRLHATY